MKSETWLLLLYALPTKRNSARVSLWRRLKKFGAVQLKTSAYLLPDQPANYERFQWLAEQIQHDGGEATLIRVAEIEGFSQERIVQLFNNARSEDYQQLIRSFRDRIGGKKKPRGEQFTAELEKFQREFIQVKEVDYFNCPAAQKAQTVVEKAGHVTKPPKNKSPLQIHHYQGRTWLTRPRPGVDRVGSAWLIRRFIDPKAKFVFAAEVSAHPKAIPFDMYRVEFSHHADDCTFETLLKRFGIEEKALQAMGEMVHDADLEDGKFQRSECLGIDRILNGWAKAGLSDQQIIKQGSECFEGLYRQLQK